MFKFVNCCHSTLSCFPGVSHAGSPNMAGGGSACMCPVLTSSTHRCTHHADHPCHTPYHNAPNQYQVVQKRDLGHTTSAIQPSKDGSSSMHSSSTYPALMECGSMTCPSASCNNKLKLPCRTPGVPLVMVAACLSVSTPNPAASTPTSQI